ncbi:MAG: enoyl-CoA hydratase/isomerase family protein [Proteobacteria bacterium]|nr:enoyl-CoA hydratase/isomerase family protein [Pseudomonadota bacterium]
MLKLETDKMIAEKDGAIGWVTFNNPERRNAMSLEMWSALATILDSYEADDAIRVIVMKGAGDKAFVSGADISQFEKQRADADAAERYNQISEAGRKRLGGLEKPLIAMINGFCLGGGLAIAMAADLRFAATGSQFGIPAARLGIAYGSDGLSRLNALVGPSAALDILFSARRLPAEEALSLGLINKVLPAGELEGFVRDYAANLAINAPLSMRASKLTIRELAKSHPERDHELLKKLMQQCFDSADYTEGRKAFMEKRKPVFTGR